VIVIEGPDGAGKTTLARDLLDSYEELRPAPHTELPQEERNRLRERNQHEFVLTSLAEAVESHGPIRVHDRIFFSHLVYQPVVDKAAVQFSEREKQMIRGVMSALSVPIIMCLPPLDTVIANVKKSEKGQQMEGVDEKIGSIYDAYHAVGRAGMGKRFGAHDILWYDYTNELTGSYKSYDQIREIIDAYIEIRNERTW
jgi:thymidylate kinase